MELTGTIRSMCYEISNSKVIEFIDAIMSAIGVILYSTTHYLMKEKTYDIIIYCTYVTVFEFNIYFIIKFIGYGYAYIGETANRFDFLIFACCDIGIILEQTDITRILYAIGLCLHMAKSLRWLKLIRNAKLRVVVDSLTFILPSLINVCILLFIILIVYAVLGIQLFWGVEFHSDINETRNFRSFGSALLVVMVSATGEKWDTFMHDLTTSDGECVSGFQSYEDIQKNGVVGCGTSWAYPYFITFMLFVHLIGIKLFTVIVLEGYMESAIENYSIITAEDFEQFIDKWTIYDPEGTGWISVEGLVYLFFSLDPPLGVYDKSLREKMWSAYKKAKKVISATSASIKSLIEKIELNEEYILHKNEVLVFERRKIMKLLNELEIPLEVGTWRVHYRDVCKRMVIRAIRIKRNSNFQ